MHIDVKFFPVLLTGKARRHVAQSGTRGVIRRLGEGLDAGYVKPNPRLKCHAGANGGSHLGWRRQRRGAALGGDQGELGFFGGRAHLRGPDAKRH